MSSIAQPYRGVFPVAPTVFDAAGALDLDGQRLVVLAGSVAPSEPGDQPCLIVPTGAGLALATGDGRLVLD